MASTYMLANRPQSYEVKVSKAERGHKVVERKTFTDYNAAMRYLDIAEDKYGRSYIVEFDTKFH